MKIKEHILSVLAVPALLASVPVSMALLGGFVLTAKTGAPPEGWFWTELPAVGAGIIGVLCQAIIGYTAAANHRMPTSLRTLLGLLWVFSFVAFCISLPVYLVAASDESSIQDAVIWLTTTGQSGQVTWAIYTLVVAAIELAIPGVLIAIAYEQSVDASMTKATAGSTDAQGQVIVALASCGVPLNLKQIQAESGLSYAAAYSATTQLVKQNKVTKIGSGRGVTYERTT